MSRLMLLRDVQVPEVTAQCGGCAADWQTNEPAINLAKAHARQTGHEVVIITVHRTRYREEEVQ